jgi:cell wall-associated NlpC family hydrolase
VRRLALLATAVAVLFAQPGAGAAAPPPVFAVVPATSSSLSAAIRQQLAGDRRALAQVQQREHVLAARLRGLRARLSTATDPFELEDAIGAAQQDAAAAAARAGRLRQAITRLHGALHPVQLPVAITRGSSNGLGWAVVAVAEHYLGVRYRWGGGDPRAGFDCSGFVKYVYAQIGLALPHYAATQYATTPHIDPRTLTAGDLVFFEPHADGPGHVAIYIGDGVLIEAPHTGDVVKLAPLARLSASLGFVGATRPAQALGG